MPLKQQEEQACGSGVGCLASRLWKRIIAGNALRIGANRAHGGRRLARRARPFNRRKSCAQASMAYATKNQARGVVRAWRSAGGGGDEGVKTRRRRCDEAASSVGRGAPLR